MEETARFLPPNTINRLLADPELHPVASHARPSSLGIKGGCHYCAS